MGCTPLYPPATTLDRDWLKNSGIVCPRVRNTCRENLRGINPVSGYLPANFRFLASDAW